MITLFSRLAGFSILASASILALACNKVPLLAPTGSSITLTAAATTLPVNGTTDLIAQVLESAGTPPQDGTLVTFLTTLGTVQPSQAETSGGRVTVKFIAGTTSGEAKITATSGGAGGANVTSGTGSTSTTSSANSVTIKIGGAAVDNVSLTASASSVSSSGGTVTLTAAANDVSGNRLPGVPVSFSATAGTLGAAVVNTDQNGVAVTTLATSRKTTVNATAGSKKSPDVIVDVTTGPVIALSAPTPASPTVGQPVTFTVTLTAPGATGTAVRSVIVDFGDGSPQLSAGIASTTPVSHIYNSPGTYTVRATATDANGESSPAISVVTVGAQAKPTPSITATPQGGAPGTVVNLAITNNVPTGATVEDVFIDFGDGTSRDLGAQSNPTVPHIYPGPDQYPARVTVRDTNGQSGTATTIVVVGNGGGTQASFTVTPASPKRNEPAAFDGSASTGQGGITNYRWDFGDGAVTNGPTQTHTYTTAGGYNVSLTVTDSTGKTATLVKSIAVQ